MKRITKKAINKELTRRDILCRYYILRGETGAIRPDQQIFSSAWVYVDEDGNVEFYHYGYGDAWTYKLAHPEDGARVYDVSEIIESWLDWNSYDYNTRQEVVDGIYDMINKEVK